MNEKKISTKKSGFIKRLLPSQKVISDLSDSETKALNLLSKEFKTLKKKDWIKFISLFIIFFCLLFLVLTFFGRGFSFNLEIFTIRTWQFVLAFFGGGALGVAGLLLQKMTRNNLADVSILGIGSLNIIFITIFILNEYKNTAESQNLIRQFLPLVGVAASIFGTSIIYVLSKMGGAKSNRFIILGIALQFLFEAISIALVNPSISNAPGSVLNKALTEIQNFSLGRFPNVAELGRNFTWRVSTIVSISVICLIVFFIWLLRRKIDVIEANENLAITYGIKVERIRFLLYIFIAIMAGIEASMIGTIALLGILAPNVAKMIFGNRSSTNILASFMIGGILVMFAGFLSVNLNLDIPIGYLSTAIITPYFIWMIIKNKK